MKTDNYRFDFEEHRQEIKLNENSVKIDAERQPSRATVHRKSRKSRKLRKQSNHRMINIILGVFTLIPVILFLSIVFNLYFPKNNTTAKDNSEIVLETTNKVAGGKIVPTGTEGNLGTKEDEEDENDSNPNEHSEKTESEHQGTNDEQENDSETDTSHENEEKVTPAHTTHTVAAGETIWRIAMKYYQSDEGIEIIKQANGLTSNDIMAGQTLIIP